MRIGIIGLPFVGKTTLFNLLTGAGVETGGYGSGKQSTNVKTARVPDERVDYLSEMFKPKKTVYAQIEFIDIPGLRRGEGRSASSQFLESVRKVDALVHVVRAFENPEVIHSEGDINPFRDLETIGMELLFADLDIIEKRIERIKTSKKKQKNVEEELKVLVKCRDVLEEGKLISSLDLTDEEKEFLKTYSFLTEKPQILVINLDESQMSLKNYPGQSQIYDYTEKNQVPVIELCAQIEMEINSLPEEDRNEFMKEMGISEPGISRLARITYKHLGLISFFTAGEDEVKAWTIKKNTTAKKAAGKIHSDIEKGFIRAEVFHFDDLKAAGSVVGVKERGKFRLEGKDYIVKDGDIITFRFNI